MVAKPITKRKSTRLAIKSEFVRHQDSLRSGIFTKLPQEIQEDILARLPSKDLASMERSSSHFKMVIMDANLWEKKNKVIAKKLSELIDKKIKSWQKMRYYDYHCGNCRTCERSTSNRLKAIGKEEERKTKIGKIVARSTGGGKEKLKQVVQLVIDSANNDFWSKRLKCNSLITFFKRHRQVSIPLKA